MEIATEVVHVTTTGSAGSASGNADSKAMVGFLLDIHLDFSASAPATTDTTISYQEPDFGNILVVTNSATDALIAPRQKPVDNANTAITNAHDRFPLNGAINIALVQCNALAVALTATIRYLR
jgi:hypothetical protein